MRFGIAAVLYLSVYVFVTLYLIPMVIADVRSERNPCRRAAIRKAVAAQSKQWIHSFTGQNIDSVDSDGWFRTTNCHRSDGGDCELCCNSTCCEEFVSTLGKASRPNSSALGYSAVRSPNSAEGQYGQWWIGIRFVFIGKGTDRPINGTLPFSRNSSIDYQLRILNAAYGPTPFRFFFDSFHEYYDDALFASCDTWRCMFTPNCEFYTDTMPRVKGNSSETVTMVICDVPGEFYGEAQFPWASVEDDPQQYVLIGQHAFGNAGDMYHTTYGHGKTPVHELGHYFGLLHVFEHGTCDELGDYVEDTPATLLPAGQKDDCSLVRDSCPALPGLDPITNYMNYAKDECMTVFTAGQIRRMITAMSVFRPILARGSWVPGYCNSTRQAIVRASDCSCMNQTLDPASRCSRLRNVIVPQLNFTPSSGPSQFLHNHSAGNVFSARKTTWIILGAVPLCCLVIVMFIILRYPTRRFKRQRLPQNDDVELEPGPASAEEADSTTAHEGNGRKANHELTRENREEAELVEGKEAPTDSEGTVSIVF
jgi:hypothetical protein